MNTMRYGLGRGMDVCAGWTRDGIEGAYTVAWIAYRAARVVAWAWAAVELIKIL